MKKKRMAFMGFRHGHILGLYQLARETETLEIVGACEEDPATRDALADGPVAITHSDYRTLLEETAPEIVAVGDAYARRGAIARTALARGLHVIADKPICTTLEDLDEIERLARENRCCIGCQLDLRSQGKYRTLRRLIRKERAIGEVHAIGFNGEHPLMYGERPAWYFEPGMHGGTINDIAIHAIDLIPWLTGLSFRRIHAARNWNANFAAEPHFRDAAQMMLSMNNGCGVLGDVSYLSPDSMGYHFPLYWRFTFWGREGVLESTASSPEITLFRAGETQATPIRPEESPGGDYLHSFLREIDGETRDLSPSSAEVLESSRITLQTQYAADTQATNVDTASARAGTA